MLTSNRPHLEVQAAQHRTFFFGNLSRFAAVVAICSVLLAGTVSGAQNLKFVPSLFTVATLNNVLSSPNGMATDPSGNLYIADTTHSRVWKVDVTQTVTLFAGKGSGVYSGDNGPAISAGLANPLAVATDLAGNVYIADTGSEAIRRVDHATGIITTVAGGNGIGYTGDNGLATAAKLTFPSGVVVDPAGNIYISDGSSAVVRRVSTAGIITTFAGGGSPATGNGDGGPAASAKLLAPYGLALDSNGTLYIADQTAGLVRKVSTSGIISTFAGSTTGNSGMGGPATSAQLRAPRAISVDPLNNVYIADGATGLVSVVDSTNTINVVAGLGVFGGVGDGLPASEVTLAVPYGIAVDGAGHLFAASNTQNAVYEIFLHPERFPLTKVGSPSGAQRLILENFGSSSLTPTSITFTGDFATAANPGLNSRPCTANSAIATGFGNYCTFDVVFAPTAAGIRAFPLTIVSNDTPTTQVLTLTSTGLSPSVATSGGEIFTVAGLFPGNQATPGDNISALLASLNGINGIVTDSAGDIIFTEYGYCLIRKVNAVTGIISTIAGVNPLTCGTDNVANGPNGDGGPATLAQLYLPGPVAYGTDGTLYVADDGHYKIRSIDPQGKIHSYAGNGSNLCAYTTDGNPAISTPICGASGMAIDAQNNIYYTDGANEAIFKVSAAGILTRVAGVISLGSGSFSGDGGPALSAHLNTPYGIAVDKLGNIYFSDRANFVIRRIDAVSNIITTIAGKPGVSSYSGDGGPAINSTLGYVAGVAIDTAGNLYLADSVNNVVRRIDATTGVITTVAGNFVVGGLYNGDGIPATDAGISSPTTVAVDPAGYVLIGDNNRLIREVDPNGTINFGGQNLNTTSTSKSVTVSNIGNMPLHFDATTPYSVVGDFAYISGGTCNFTQVLAAGASCTVQVTFTPTVAYTRYGALALNDDGVASPQLVSLVGSGNPPVSAPQAVLNPTTVPFASQQAGTTSSGQVVVLSNPGNATLNITSLTLTGANPTAFSINSACGATLAANTSCNISVTFNPATGVTGALAAAITVVDNAANSPQASTLTGTSTAPAAPAVTLLPATLSFPNTAVGSTSAAQTVTLTNTGTATLNIPGYQTNGGSFTVGNSTCLSTLAAGSACTFSIAFVPQTAGPLTGNLTVSDNAPGAPHVVTFSGTATAAPTPQAVLAPTSIPFANQVIGTTSASQVVTLSNPGGATLNITSITLAGANPTAFVLTNGCGTTLAVGASCPLTVSFTPGSVASFSAAINVVDNATTSPQSVTLTGTGVAAPAPQAVLSPTSLTFAGQLSGTTSASQTVTLSNPGNAVLNIAGITVTGANASSFAMTNGCGATLAAGASCPIGVTFTPGSATTFSAAISVADNATGSPQSAALSGTGLAPADFATSSPTPPQTVTAGKAATYAINVAPTSGSFNLPVTLTATGLPTGATAVFTPPVVTPGGAGATSTLVIQTSATVAQLGTDGEGQPHRSNSGGLVDVASSFAAMACLFFLCRMPRLSNSRRLLMLAGGLVLMSLGMSACGGGFPGSGNSKTYIISVTGTNGSDNHGTTITLTVQ